VIRALVNPLTTLTTDLGLSICVYTFEYVKLMTETSSGRTASTCRGGFSPAAPLAISQSSYGFSEKAQIFQKIRIEPVGKRGGKRGEKKGREEKREKGCQRIQNGCCAPVLLRQLGVTRKSIRLLAVFLYRH